MATIDDLRFALTLFAALGCGIIGGVFFAFSTFVMKALARLSPAEGIAAMQTINIVVINPVFLGVFLGTAAACAVVIISSFLRWQDSGSFYSLVGGLLYLVGTIMVTAVFNIPKNNSLAAVNPTAPESANLWADYLVNWTAWNHVRAAAAIAAAAALIISLCQKTTH